jgi:hypothetical protein
MYALANGMYKHVYYYYLTQYYPSPSRFKKKRITLPVHNVARVPDDPSKIFISAQHPSRVVI